MTLEVKGWDLLLLRGKPELAFLLPLIFCLFSSPFFLTVVLPASLLRSDPGYVWQQELFEARPQWLKSL